LQGRGAIVADGEPRQDHARAQVQLRLRGRLDAQGPGHLPRGSEAERREAPGDAGRRRLLRPGVEGGGEPLGYVVADHPTLREPPCPPSSTTHPAPAPSLPTSRWKKPAFPTRPCAS